MRIPKNFISDPFDVPSLEKAIKHSARLQDDIFRSRLSADRLSLEGDKFSNLSPEILQLTSILLPTNDIRSLRLASPAFALVPLPEKFWASRFQQGSDMANRRRVWGLTKRLQTTLYQLENVACNGFALETWYKPSAAGELHEQEEKVLWCTAARGIQGLRHFDYGCRVLRARALRFSQPLELDYIWYNVSLGREPRDFPRWRLTEAEGISAIKAEFDALKLISLSRNSVPLERMLYNGIAGDLPPTRFNAPISTLFFGGSNGQYLPSLVEIVVWVFDKAYIAGIEFVCTDVSQNRHLGHIGPFDDYPGQRTFSDSEDHRISMSIDGSTGEELNCIEAQMKGPVVVGLKMRTSFVREARTPQHPFAIKKDWITVHPTGSKVVGLFCTHMSVVWNLGLISTNPDINRE
ncbi:hypothetical protein EDB81DRAFT_764952 [Dactylonectria macrodidyma]|uniref:DUF7600 domain-containing protein n=1 Tax=Dactylonectria macrodidyma TaxID=307937 RepID=A0A9P9DV78_9HYPO|nr:hypothetical protein EDB81DRAFT_764952 [Dactylonectria macrodidyma]